MPATALTLEDVKEASAKVSPRALEAALVETRASFDLTSKSLLDLERRRRSRERGRSHRRVVLSRSIRHRANGVRRSGLFADHRRSIPGRLGVRLSVLVRLLRPVLRSVLAGLLLAVRVSVLRTIPTTAAAAVTSIDGGGGGGGGNIPQQPSGRGRVVDGQGYTRVRPRESRACHARHRRIDRKFERRRWRLFNLVVIGRQFERRQRFEPGLFERRLQRRRRRTHGSTQIVHNAQRPTIPKSQVPTWELLNWDWK